MLQLLEKYQLSFVNQIWHRQKLTEKLKWFNAVPPTAIKDTSETIIPNYVKFMYVRSFNFKRPNLTAA